MAKKYRWTPAKYKAALLGNRENGVEGLRSLVKGFDAKDGYDVRNIDEWTPQQRRRVREYFGRVEQLEAQSKLVVRPKSEKNLRQLQKSFHGDVASKEFKVAYVPYHEPKVTLPGAKKRKPKIRISSQGVSIQTKQYERVFIPFNQKSLVKNARSEIQRAARAIPGASLYFVQTGDNQTIHGQSLGIVTTQILKWMEQYDGVSPLPASSGNRGDSPKSHHWKYWLNGLVGYVLPRGQDVRKMAQIIREGRAANEERKRKLRNYMHRKTDPKGRK